MLDGGLAYDGRRGSFQIMPGIAFNSEGIDFSNYHLNVEMGLRLFPSKGFDSSMLVYTYKKLHNTVGVGNFEGDQYLTYQMLSLRFDF